MAFQKIRRDLIAFRTANARSPALFHRASTAVEQLQHLQTPANAQSQRRLIRGLQRTTREMEAAKRESGRYVPSHQRTRPYRKSR